MLAAAAAADAGAATSAAAAAASSTLSVSLARLCPLATATTHRLHVSPHLPHVREPYARRPSPPPPPPPPLLPRPEPPLPLLLRRRRPRRPPCGAGEEGPVVPHPAPAARQARQERRRRHPTTTTKEQDEEEEAEMVEMEIEASGFPMELSPGPMPQLPGEQPDFWEGPRWDALGFFVQYQWAFGIVFALIACGIAVSTYNEGATDFRDTPAYKESIQSRELLEEPESSNSDVFEGNPTEVAPSSSSLAEDNLLQLLLSFAPFLLAAAAAAVLALATCGRGVENLDPQADERARELALYLFGPRPEEFGEPTTPRLVAQKNDHG
uniref:Uncharacterized protein n=1 Tax=Ananas comosus var. bracteatus TaxID=296719 RepID=A0A6V7PP52_ANACO|nr:unnamed protein product [Ananas comosus var. bracteatus]